MIIGISFASQYFAQEMWDVFENRKQQLLAGEDISSEDVDYLVGVMVKYIDGEKFKSDYTETPIFDLRKSQITTGSVNSLKDLADFCLFRVGFFPLGFDHRHRSPRENFIVAGQKAYWNLSQKVSELEMFRSMAMNFIIFANLISELKLRGADEKDIIQLFQFWQETGSKFAQEQLEQLGMINSSHLKC